MIAHIVVTVPVTSSGPIGGFFHQLTSFIQIRFILSYTFFHFLKRAFPYPFCLQLCSVCFRLPLWAVVAHTQHGDVVKLRCISDKGIKTLSDCFQLCFR